MGCSKLLILGLVLNVAHCLEILGEELVVEIKLLVKHDITAILGEEVYLSCKYLGENTIIRAEWKRQTNSKTSKRLTGFANGKPFSRDSNFSIPASPTNLTVKMRVSSVEAEGEYICVFMTEDQDFSHSTFLTVLARPDTHILVNEETVNGTHYQSVSCSAVNGRPLPQISWLVSGLPPSVYPFTVEMSDTAHPDGTATMSSILRFPTHLQDEDRVTCVVQHPTLPSPKLITVRVDTYETYADAQAKLNRAEDTSVSVQTDTEVQENHKRRPTRKQLNSSSEESDIYSEDELPSTPSHQLTSSAAQAGPRITNPAAQGGPGITTPAARGPRIPSPAVQESRRIPSPAVQESWQIPSPAVQESRQIPSPAVQESRQIPSPTVQGSLRIPSPIVLGSQRIPSPAVQEIQQIPSPAVQESRQIPSPTVQGSLRIHNPTVQESRQIPSPAVQESRRIPSPIVLGSQQIPSPTVLRSQRIPSPTVQGSRRIPRPTVQESQRILSPAVQGSRRIPSPAVGTPRARGKAMFSHILMVLEEIKETQQIQRQMINALLKQGDCASAILPDGANFPLASIEDVNSIEQRLVETAFMNNVVSIIRDIGGATLDEAIQRIMAFLMTNDLALQYNLAGCHGKRAFETLRLFEVIYGGLKKNKMTQTVNKKEAKKAISKWFKGARDRGGDRALRAQRL
ncbi:hemicentin-2-like isoform X2 [Centroberyx affinis]|uniref:hemicentin-2-like isoform X2 n=1 Tax=Centroberyx affinis TaxID=166261 RepID=UPI003A5C3E41